jgi:hypothetical protein
MPQSGSVLRRLGEGLIEAVVDCSGLPKAGSVEPLDLVPVFSAWWLGHRSGLLLP